MVDDEKWMRRALELALRAKDLGEVPVGAVITLNDELIAEGFNQPITHQDPSAHAEIVALRLAAEKIGNYRLLNATLYVTLEPCMMCFGAMVHARIGRLVYGAPDPKTGCIDSAAQLLEVPFLNHRFAVSSGILAEESSQLLQSFFRERREKK